MKLTKNMRRPALERLARKWAAGRLGRKDLPVYVMRPKEGAAFCWGNGSAKRLSLKIRPKTSPHEFAILLAHELAHAIHIRQDKAGLARQRRRDMHGERFQRIFWKVLPRRYWDRASSGHWIRGRSAHQPKYRPDQQPDIFDNEQQEAA